MSDNRNILEWVTRTVHLDSPQKIRVSGKSTNEEYILERLITFLNLGINEFKHLIKRLSKKKLY
jgi:hypothetical protein